MILQFNILSCNFLHMCSALSPFFANYSSFNEKEKKTLSSFSAGASSRNGAGVMSPLSLPSSTHIASNGQWSWTSEWWGFYHKNYCQTNSKKQYHALLSVLPCFVFWRKGSLPFSSKLLVDQSPKNIFWEASLRFDFSSPYIRLNNHLNIL